jgi:dipeptidyl-peptidase-4
MKQSLFRSPNPLLAMLVLVTGTSIAAANQRAVTDLRIDPAWLDDGSLEFTRTVDDQPRRFRVDPKTGDEITTDGGISDRHVIANPRRSRGGGESMDVRIENRTDLDLQLVWLDPGGDRRAYGSVAAGTRRSQHTFSGHAWLLLDDAQEPVLGFRATAGSGPVVVDDAALETFRDVIARSSEPRASSRPNDEDARPIPFIRDRALWIRNPDGGERRLAEDPGPTRRWTRRWSISPDGRFLLAIEVEPGEDHPVTLIDVAPDDRVEPRLETLSYRKPGDRIDHPRPVVFEVATGRRFRPTDEHIPDPWSIGAFSWHPDGQRVRFLHNQRGHQALRLMEIDAVSSTIRTLIDEQSDTFIDYAGKRFLHVLADGDRAIWMNERTGWNHLDLIHLDTGERRPITSGNWVVRAVDAVDEDSGTIRIRVMGIDPNQDPYHVHHAIVSIEDGSMTRLTRGDGTHDLEFSPDGEHYVDRWSRVDRPPVHELRRTSDGGLVTTLATADHARLLESGWQEPERFVAKGRDGETDIWGVIVRPADFDPAKTYPVVEHIYAGPHDHFVPKSFAPRWRMREIADRGFIVVQIDGMGTNWRSKAFHDVAWKNLGDSGFPDRIAWMKAAAADRPWMDLDRVGIYGGSAGGQSALRALLAFGDFYDVAVADCGCHDNRMDKIWWNELWMGWPIGPHYAEQSNVTNAHRLEGELMLILGGLDRNVDPTSTLQVVDALVKADKNFEFVLLPTAGHGAAETPYGHRRRMDFLERKLLGDD